ncbi:MAG: hypothetical protein IT209_04140 [Armatimonadetes bacterium]|nr:hypothetical protein [Armatimonadota bacterium]
MNSMQCPQGHQRRSLLLRLRMCSLLAVILGIALGAHAHAAPPGQPQNVSFAPASGTVLTGQPRDMYARYLHPDGSQFLARTFVLINNTLNPHSAAYLFYDVATDNIYLRNDNNSQWLGGFHPGSSNTIENSFVRVDCANTEVTTTPSVIVVKYRVVFKIAKGAVRVFELCSGTFGGMDGFDQMGSFSIVAPLPPLNESVTPGSGTLGTDTPLNIAGRYSDPNGVRDLARTFMLISTDQGAANAIFLYYDVNSNRVFLRNDSNTAWLGGFAPGSAQTIENSQVRVDLANTALTQGAYAIYVSYRLTLKAPMSNKELRGLLFCSDDGGLTDGWDDLAQFSTVTRQAPVNASLTPLSQTIAPNTAQILTSTHTDGNGATNLARVLLVLNPLFTFQNSILLFYDANTNSIYLRSDDNSSWLGGYAPGAAETLANSRVSVDIGATTATFSADTLTIDWKLTFLTPTAGSALTGWLFCVDDNGLTDGWDQLGTYTISSSSGGGTNPYAPFGVGYSASYSITYDPALVPPDTADVTISGTESVNGTTAFVIDNSPLSNFAGTASVAVAASGDLMLYKECTGNPLSCFTYPTPSKLLPGTMAINDVWYSKDRNDNTVTCTIIATNENFAVAAGTFNNIVQVRYTSSAQLLELWFAPNVGIIRAQASKNGIISTAELTSYSVP